MGLWNRSTGGSKVDLPSAPLVRDMSIDLFKNSGEKSVDFSAEMWAAINGGWGVPTKSGTDISVSTALQVPAFYRGVMVIAEGIAQLPVALYRTLPSGKGVEPAVDHPLYDVLLHQASELQDAFQFYTTVLMHAAATGNSVSYKVVVNGETRELIPVRPESSEIDILSPFMRKTYRLTFETGLSATMGASEVFHLSGPGWRCYKGIDPSLIGREALGLARATEESQARLHSNGVRPSGMFSPSASGRTLTKEQVDHLRAQISETYAGLQNAMKVIVSSGAMDYKPFTMTGVDAQHLETRKHQIEEICRVLGVFPIMVGHAGDQSPTFASAEAFFDAHVRYTLQPWLSALKAAINSQLLTKDERREGYFVRIDTSELTRGSLEARTRYYQAGLGTNSNPGWLTSNEVREDDGWNPIDEPSMDQVRQPLTMSPNGKPQTDGASPIETPPAAGEKAMTSRTLYVSRKLLNTKEFITWAKSQGFTTATPADELHVTIAYSKAKIDWMCVGEAYDRELIVAPGGPRAVELLGKDNAVVLKFASWALGYRNAEIRDAGASWDYPEYQPHVTITYDGSAVELSKVEPFQGELRFGPEIFAEIIDGMSPKET